MATKEQIEHGELDVMTPEEVKALMDKGEAVLVDVRTPAEYAFERVRGAMLLPLSDFDERALPMQDGKRIVLYCSAGVRSKLAAERLLEAGKGPVAHIEGGLGAWKRAKLPFIVTDPISGAPRDVIPG